MSDFAAKKILVIRLSSLGDVVLTTALFPSLAARWPMARVSVATRTAFAPVFAGNPHVHEVLTFGGSVPFSALARRVKAERWDVVIDLHGNPRSWILRLLAGGRWTVQVEKESVSRHMLVYTKRAAPGLSRSVRERVIGCLGKIGVPVVSTETQVFPASADRVAIQHGLPASGVLIGVAPGARHATKRWPPDRFAAAANELAQARGATVVVLGDSSDEGTALEVVRALQVPHVNLAGKTSLAELIAVTSRLSLLLTNDSGLMHIGEALRVPLVALFGPTVRAFGFAPYRATSRVVETSLSCRPCTLHGTAKCPLGHHRCMKDLDVSAVVSAADAIHPLRGAA